MHPIDEHVIRHRPSGIDSSSGYLSEMAKEAFEVSNEFATVKIRIVETRHGQRLEIASPELERSIRLSSIELESLTWQDHETFTEFLETPFGEVD